MRIFPPSAGIVPALAAVQPVVALQEFDFSHIVRIIFSLL